MNLPNRLTIIRMILTPVFLAVFLADIPHRFLYALILFVVASFTDTLDGYIARKKNIITVFGKLADPVADKVLTTAALLALMHIGYCNIWLVALTLTREFAVTSFRLVAASDGLVVPANIFGKIKTISQMVFTSLIILLLELKEVCILPQTFNLALFSNILIGITTLFTLISGAIYIVKITKKIDFSK
ncbi:MAG: CDP-diacylglycerol--glycerol-3-phosphate 3-phosphatidyltransferase [Clostridia bacterium]|nr:CDP-diacylglycerol--glycerol-3-phosphate 3-phosphatidyltransferase [Clostridia bacterium]